MSCLLIFRRQHLRTRRLSRRTLVTLGNDANAVYEYDLGNRLTRLTNNIDDTNSITFEYSNYDKVGNRLSMKIDDANAYVFTYDNLYQLTFVDYNDSNSTSYYYDSVGNRTDVDDGTPTTYLRNNLNQYTSVGGTNYSYDNKGNLTDDGLFKYYYDCENRLTDVNNQSDTAVASYSYDYLGRRISKTVYGSPDVTTKYCYDGDHVIVEYDGSDNLLRKFIYGPGIDEPICMIDVTDSNAVYYYHFDGLGSVAALSDAGADIVESYSYDVFGAPTIYDENKTEISQSAISNPYMFTARRADDETALYYYRARYYAFDIGRFLQTDPIGYYDGLNMYTYCGNNPIVFNDPWGLSWLDPPRPNDNFWGPIWDIGNAGRDIYHLGAAGVCATEAGISATLAYVLEPLSYVSYLGDEIVVPATPFNQSFTIPTGFIGNTAEAIDLNYGDWLENHTGVALTAARQHLLESGFAPGEVAYVWKEGAGIIGEWKRGSDGIWRPVLYPEPKLIVKKPTPQEDKASKSEMKKEK